MKQLGSIILENLSKDEKRSLFNFIRANIEFVPDLALQEIEDIIKNSSYASSANINDIFIDLLGKRIDDDRLNKLVVSTCTDLGIKSELVNIFQNVNYQLPWSHVINSSNTNNGNLYTLLNTPKNKQNYIGKILDKTSIDTLFDLNTTNKNGTGVGKGELLFKLILQNVVINNVGDVTITENGNITSIEFKVDNGSMASQQPVEGKTANTEFIDIVLSHYNIKPSDINKVIKEVSNVKTKKDGTETEAAGPLSGPTNMFTCYNILFDYINPSNIKEYNQLFLEAMRSVLYNIYKSWDKLPINEFTSNGQFIKAVSNYSSSLKKLSNAEIKDIYRHMCVSACMNYKSYYNYLLLFNSTNKNYCVISNAASHNEVYSNEKIRFSGGFTMSTRAGIRAKVPKITVK